MTNNWQNNMQLLTNLSNNLKIWILITYVIPQKISKNNLPSYY
jgi:hypothetical protein